MISSPEVRRPERRWGRRRRYDRAVNTLLTAALPATPHVPSTVLVPTPAPVPAGLTAADAARISAAIAAARAESTREVYARAWSLWERWCLARGIAPLPAEPLALCAYLTERAAAGRAMNTLDLACTVIRHVARTTGTSDPVATEAVRQVRRGLVRTYGAAPRRLARPLNVSEIRQIVAAIDRTTPHGLRDAAMILLG